LGKKQDVISILFKQCKEDGNFEFDNRTVKKACEKVGFGNPFDVTKLDNTSIFPEILLNEDYFILHLGRGKHKFIKGISHGYHTFEDINDSDIFDWKYRKSILNEFDTSESNILSVAGNQRIIHDFIFEDIVSNPKVYNSRRTKFTFSYTVGNEIIEAKNLQMEIDLTMELNGLVTVFEGKNRFPENFAIYQLFHPFKYYTNLRDKKRLNVKQISCCYILRDIKKKCSILRLYNYTFEDENNISSIKLLKSAQYNLIKR